MPLDLRTALVSDSDQVIQPQSQRRKPLDDFELQKKRLAKRHPKTYKCSICYDLHIIAQSDSKGPEDFVRSAARGCAGCKLLSTILSPHLPQDASNVTISLSFHSESGLTLQIWIGESLQKALKIYTDKENICPWNRIPQGDAISGDTQSPEAIIWLARHIQICRESHTKCGPDEQSIRLPTRVLEILDQDSVRLRVTTGTEESALYTCLSHCWGSGQHITTRKSNLSDHQESIPWDNLPRTFREAVNVTWNLGVKYVWIDSLCIVQDDGEDWRREGSKMCSIYSNACLTIAASKSSDSSGGCFSTSFSQSYAMHNTESGEDYNIYVHDPIDHMDDTEETPKLPLMTRAWVFQERILSPRTVYFGPQELSWECRELATCECGSWQRFSTLKTETMSPSSTDLSEDTPTSDQEIRNWHNILQDYSQKSIKYASDIFPALQGVATHYLPLRKSAYHAGLWESSLIEDLLWGCLEERQRAAPWRAPTWSWASVAGEITYSNVDSEHFKTVAKVLKVSTEPLGHDPLGQLTSGVLYLEAPCLDNLTLTYFEQHENYKIEYKHPTPDPSSENPETETKRLSVYSYDLLPDYPLTSHLDKSCVVVKIMERGRFDDFDYYLLLMRVNDGSQDSNSDQNGNEDAEEGEEEETFERIGVIRTYFDGAFVEFFDRNMGVRRVRVV